MAAWKPPEGSLRARIGHFEALQGLKLRMPGSLGQLEPRKREGAGVLLGSAWHLEGCEASLLPGNRLSRPGRLEPGSLAARLGDSENPCKQRVCRLGPPGNAWNRLEPWRSRFNWATRTKPL